MGNGAAGTRIRTPFELIDPAVPVGHRQGRVVREECLGGLRSFYRRRAAA